MRVFAIDTGYSIDDVVEEEEDDVDENDVGAEVEGETFREAKQTEEQGVAFTL